MLGGSHRGGFNELADILGETAVEFVAITALGQLQHHVSTVAICRLGVDNVFNCETALLGQIDARILTGLHHVIRQGCSGGG